MTFTRKINKPFHPPLIMNNTIINQVTEHKHLGLEISNDGSWQKHIDLITKKAFIRVNILRKFKFILDRKTLEKIYLTFIRPILEYADVVWDNKTLFLINVVVMNIFKVTRNNCTKVRRNKTVYHFIKIYFFCISNDGSWQKHIDLITKKAFNRVNILRKFKFILDRKTLIVLWMSELL
jgi:hypothetical protein